MAESMEFLAATKDGIIIYDALNPTKNEGDRKTWRDGQSTVNDALVKVVAKIPSPSNAFGHAWSEDGTMLGSVCDEGVRIYDATNKYKKLHEFEKVAPDVGGRQGGVRNLMFSPKKTALVTYEKWDPQYPENVHVWSLEGDAVGTRLHSCTLKGYTSGALPVSIIRWTSDEATSVELVSGKGLVLRDTAFGDDAAETRLIAEKNCANFIVSPPNPKGEHFVSCFIPETGVNTARIAVYDLANAGKAVNETHLPAKVKDARMMWNHDGTTLLVLANSDVDETGCSYFGSTFLYWIKSDSKAQAQVFGSKDGQVQDIAWSPTENQFAAVVGFQPAKVTVWDGKTGKLISTLGSARRNTLVWNTFGRFLAVGGFGTLAGDLDFYDQSKGETIVSLRAPLTVHCDFGPDGRHFLACTVAPRMNEGNQISMYKYTGELLYKMDYVPDVIEGRHEDTGAGARTKTQALLFAASWRPAPAGVNKFQDRAASPPPSGVRRKKGLPEQASAVAASSAPAYRPRGAEAAGSSVAAMMRGEIATPAPTAAWGADGPTAPNLAPMEEWEIKKLEKEARKLQEKKDKEEAEALQKARTKADKGELNNVKKLKALKDQLALLDELKEKDWDELTEEDEEQLEGEVEIRAQIAELEKKVGDMGIDVE